jgi:hypothetical protein
VIVADFAPEAKAPAVSLQALFGYRRGYISLSNNFMLSNKPCFSAVSAGKRLTPTRALQIDIPARLSV